MSVTGKYLYIYLYIFQVATVTQGERQNVARNALTGVIVCNEMEYYSSSDKMIQPQNTCRREGMSRIKEKIAFSLAGLL